MGIASGGPAMGDEVVDRRAMTSALRRAQCLYGLYVTTDPDLAAASDAGCCWAISARACSKLGTHKLRALGFRRRTLIGGFYDRLGGREIARGRWDVDGITLIEIAYGWPDIRSLIEACSAVEVGGAQ